MARLFVALCIILHLVACSGGSDKQATVPGAISPGAPPSGGGGPTVPPTPSGSAGTLLTSSERWRLLPNYEEGKITHLGASDGRGYKIPASDIARVCWYSDRKGWGPTPGNSPTNCAIPAADGMLGFPSLCNSDRGLVAVWTKSGSELWPDFRSNSGWKLAGDQNPKLVGNFIEYGANGFQISTISAEREANGLIALTIDFGSDCLGGFTEPIIPGDLMFVWHSDEVGWGITNPWMPSTIRGYLTWDQPSGHYSVKLRGVTCDPGNVSVYRPLSGSGSGVVWDPGQGGDGLGFAWLLVPPKAEALSPWKLGTGAAWDHEKGRIRVALPGC